MQMEIYGQLRDAKCHLEKYEKTWVNKEIIKQSFA